MFLRSPPHRVAPEHHLTLPFDLSDIRVQTHPEGISSPIRITPTPHHTAKARYSAWETATERWKDIPRPVHRTRAPTPRPTQGVNWWEEEDEDDVVSMMDEDEVVSTMDEEDDFDDHTFESHESQDTQDEDAHESQDTQDDEEAHDAHDTHDTHNTQDDEDTHDTHDEDVHKQVAVVDIGCWPGKRRFLWWRRRA